MMINNKMTLALTSLLLAGQAQATITAPQLHGDLRFNLTHADSAFAANPGGGKGTTLQNDFSAIGIKGEVPLNQQLTLLYKAEVMINGDDSDDSTPFKARDTFVGLKSQYGTLTFGKMLTAFLKSEGGIDKFNVSNADINRLFAGQDRMGDVIEYQSPALGQTRLLATYLLEDDAFSDGSAKDRAGDPYAVTLLHGDKRLKKTHYFVSASYNAGLKNEEMWRLVGQWKVGQLELGALYQDTQDLQYRNLDGQGFMLSASYPIADKLLLKARYGQDDSGNGKYIDKVIASFDSTSSKFDRSSIVDNRVSNITVGADYQLNKATKLFAHYSHFDADFSTADATIYNDSDNLISVGLWYKF